MQDNFTKALNHILVYEGGYVDHPLDPGGATNLGITRKVLSRFRGRKVSKSEVRLLTHQEAAQIYQKHYWMTCHCDKLPSGLDLAVFDCAVNQGVSRAKKFLQKAVRVKVDGAIGPITLAAVRKANSKKLLTEFMARRMSHYGSLKRLFQTFGLGWSRRLMAAHSHALALFYTNQTGEHS
ncbi:MAG: glycoside hydrolase family 108 protein [Pseudomonadota bacterium]